MFAHVVIDNIHFGPKLDFDRPGKTVPGKLGSGCFLQQATRHEPAVFFGGHEAARWPQVLSDQFESWHLTAVELLLTDKELAPPKIKAVPAPTELEHAEVHAKAHTARRRRLTRCAAVAAPSARRQLTVRLRVSERPSPPRGTLLACRGVHRV